MKINLKNLLSKILILPYFINKIKSRNKIRNKILEEEEDLDFDSVAINIIKSLKLAKKLHRDLIKQIHSDRIQDDTKIKQADELAAKINAAKKNYAELENLKKEVAIFMNPH
jgi:hypothetical protein